MVELRGHMSNCKWNLEASKVSIGAINILWTPSSSNVISQPALRNRVVVMFLCHCRVLVSLRGCCKTCKWIFCRFPSQTVFSEVPGHICYLKPLSVKELGQISKWPTYIKKQTHFYLYICVFTYTSIFLLTRLYFCLISLSDASWSTCNT